MKIDPSRWTGVQRLGAALLVPWFAYWAWRIFEAQQLIWSYGDGIFGSRDLYSAAQRDRDHSLFVALGVPLLIVALTAAVRWVKAGFDRDKSAGL